MKKTVLIALLFSAVNTKAQNVGIGTNTPDASAQLDVTSSNKGMLIPRLTLTQRNAITTPATGLLVYQTDNTPGFYFYNGSSWQALNTGGGFSLPYYNNFTGSLLGSRIGMQIDLSSNYGETAFRSDVKNVGATGFFGKAAGLSSVAARFTIDTASAAVGKTALITEDGPVILNQLSGNTGIGTTPAYKLDVNGRMRIRHNNFTSGVWFNKSDNTEGAFVGMVNDSTAGFWGNGTSGNWRMALDVKNSLLGIGVTDPTAPLSFSSAIGNKISLWGNADGGHYGFGIQGSLLQMYTDQSGSDIAFGYGRSSAFTELMRIKGTGNVGIGTNAPLAKLDVTSDNNNLFQLTNTTSLNTNTSNRIYFKNGSFYTGIIETRGTGTNSAAMAFSTYSSTLANSLIERLTILDNGNVGVGYNTPAFKLDVAGRMRLRYNLADGSAGLWFNKTDNTQGTFIGQYDDTNLGIWGPGATGSWKFLFDGNDGTVRIGTTTKATGYLVNVGGKVIAEEVKVSLVGNWPDYVFGEKYNLQPIASLENYIRTNNHLPGIPAAAEMEKNGVELGNMQKKMMEKIEELTLYIIQLKKENDEMKSSIEQLQNKINH